MVVFLLETVTALEGGISLLLLPSSPGVQRLEELRVRTVQLFHKVFSIGVGFFFFVYVYLFFFF